MGRRRNLLSKSREAACLVCTSDAPGERNPLGLYVLRLHLGRCRGKSIGSPCLVEAYSGLLPWCSQPRSLVHTPAALDLTTFKRAVFGVLCTLLPAISSGNASPFESLNARGLRKVQISLISSFLDGRRALTPRTGRFAVSRLFRHLSYYSVPRRVASDPNYPKKPTLRPGITKEMLSTMPLCAKRHSREWRFAR